MLVSYPCVFKSSPHLTLEADMVQLGNKKIFEATQVMWASLVAQSPRAWGPSGREGPRLTKATVLRLVGGPYDSSKKVATFQPETSRPTNMVPASFHQPWRGRSQLPQLPARSRDGPAPQHTSPGPLLSTSISWVAWGAWSHPCPTPGLAELGGLHNSDIL